ncbi:Cell division protein ftsZ [Castilleja foliolosa]|uniref:Cell division protein ftsZ n=1 Tax=Castilleja foliolosa TaxID=1961234 RepID=A0ABD3D2S9_9LAMI
MMQYLLLILIGCFVSQLYTFYDAIFNELFDEKFEKWIVSHKEEYLEIPGLVNVDFADVKAVMKDSRTAMLGVGVSSSKNRAEEAAEQATLAPLIGSSFQSATGVVYNITGRKDITLQEVNRLSQCKGALLIYVAVLDMCYKHYGIQKILKKSLKSFRLFRKAIPKLLLMMLKHLNK